MALNLKIENETSLPDGGPLGITVTGKRGIDIGRDSHLDWTLPDPARYISSKHCEIRYKDGGYWLHDVSSNGTFLNGADHRVQAPHRLRDGDRLSIGHYIIAVKIDDEDATPAPQRPQQLASSYQELWKPVEESAPPIARSELKAPRDGGGPVNPDFLDWAADVPDEFAAAPWREPSAPAAPRRDPPPLPHDDMGWARGEPPKPPQPEPAALVPTPRRPAGVSSEPDAPRGEPSSAASADRNAPAATVPAPIPPTIDAMAARGIASESFVSHLARGAGVPEQVFGCQHPDQLAEQLGLLMRLIVDNVRQLLASRHQAKRFARTSSQTLIEAVDNNPLKFSPTTEDALRIMFGAPTASYLDAPRSIEQSFDDLKTHQIKTYSAMQQALQALLRDLDPRAIERESEGGRGIAALVSSRKAKLWDVYVARWQAKTLQQEGGIVDAFMLQFAEAYDRTTTSGESSGH